MSRPSHGLLRIRGMVRQSAKKIIIIILRPLIHFVVRHPALKKRSMLCIERFPAVASRLRALFRAPEETRSTRTEDSPYDLTTVLGALPPAGRRIHDELMAALAEKKGERS